MATNDVSIPVTSAPTAPPQAASAQVKASTQVNGGSTPAKDVKGGTDDFIALLAELTSTTDVSPEAIIDALKTAQTKPEETKGDQGAIDLSSLLDPQILLLLAGNAQPVTPQKSDASESAINPDAGGNGRSPALNLALLGAIASPGDQETLAGSLLTKPSTDDAAQSASNPATHVNSREGAPNEAALNALTIANAADRAIETPERSQLRTPVGTSAWTDELANKLTVFVNRGVQSASLQLSPEQLGPLEIHISISNDQTSVWFGAAHAETRTALEQALPRLRELLAGQGLNLSDAGVSREAPRDRAKQYVPSAPAPGEEREIAIASVSIRGMVDAYA